MFLSIINSGIYVNFYLNLLVCCSQLFGKHPRGKNIQLIPNSTRGDRFRPVRQKNDGQDLPNYETPRLRDIFLKCQHDSEPP